MLSCDRAGILWGPRERELTQRTRSPNSGAMGQSENSLDGEPVFVCLTGGHYKSPRGALSRRKFAGRGR